MRSIVWLAMLVAALVAAGGVSAAPADISATTFTVRLSGPGGSGTAELALNPGGKVCYVMDVTLTTPGDVPQEPGPGVGNAHLHVLSTGGISIPLDATFRPCRPARSGSGLAPQHLIELTATRASAPQCEAIDVSLEQLLSRWPASGRSLPSRRRHSRREIAVALGLQLEHDRRLAPQDDEMRPIALR